MAKGLLVMMDSLLVYPVSLEKAVSIVVKTCKTEQDENPSKPRRGVL